jgi:hypothetical protein
MPSLRDAQHAMRRSLLHGASDDALADIVGAGLSPRQRLSIYRNTMLGTLANALRLSFPAVHRLVGATFFEEAAQVFSREQVPGCADLNAYGAEFADFLQRFEPAATLAYLADVARLEWAVNRALHAPDTSALNPSTLASVAPCDHDRVCFVAHPSISLLRSTFPIDTIWRAVLQRDDAALAAIDLGGPVCLLVERRLDELCVERLEEGAWQFAVALLAGQSLGAALGITDGVDASARLAQHLLAGHCVAFHLATEETPP